MRRSGSWAGCCRLAGITLPEGAGTSRSCVLAYSRRMLLAMEL